MNKAPQLKAMAPTFVVLTLMVTCAYALSHDIGSSARSQESKEISELSNRYIASQSAFRRDADAYTLAKRQQKTLSDMKLKGSCK